MQSDDSLPASAGGEITAGSQWSTALGGGGGIQATKANHREIIAASHDTPDFYSQQQQQQQQHNEMGGLEASTGNANPRLENYTHAPPHQRSYSRSPTRSQLRSVSGPAASQHGLSTYRSNPALMPSRQQGTVKDIANRINQVRDPQPLTIRTSQSRYRRRSNGVNGTARSPTKDGAATKLQKRRPSEQRSSTRSPSNSFDMSGSFSSDVTVTSARSRSQSTLGSSIPTSPTSPKAASRPLFGEITSDGQWTGNFDIGNYGTLPAFTPRYRRGSDGTLALGHGRTQSHQEISSPQSPNAADFSLGHKRSRSELNTQRPQPSPSMPHLNTSNTPSLYPTPPSSTATSGVHSTASATSSRIPVSTSRRQSSESSVSEAPTNSRSASALSNRPGRRRLSKSPTRKQQSGLDNKENSNTSPISRNRRYEPPPISISAANQKLSAKIVAPAPTISPPLRSSRPRQPVSSATTSASRARAAEASHHLRGNTPTDRRRPSEQWLGKPYDPKKEQAKRKIPQLGKVDFEERRQRIQKAISQSLEESKSKESLNSSGSRKTSTGTDVDDNTSGASQDDERPIDTEEAYGQGLSLETEGLQETKPSEEEPMTAATEFEDESPILGRISHESDHHNATEEPPDTPTGSTPTLLSSAIYQPSFPKASTAKPASVPPRISTVEEAPEENVKSPSLLENVMRMRERSLSSASRDGTEFADESPTTARASTFNLEDRWGLGPGFDRSGSIKIMLDQDPPFRGHAGDWKEEVQQRVEEVQQRAAEEDVRLPAGWNEQSYTANGYYESPVEQQDRLDANSTQEAADEAEVKEATSQSDTSQTQHMFNVDRGALERSSVFSQALDNYQQTGEVSPTMLRELETHMVDLNGASMNGGSDAMAVQNLLDSIAGSRPQPKSNARSKPGLDVKQGLVPNFGPDTPSDFNPEEGGAAYVYSPRQSESYTEFQEDDDFASRIARADEEWEQHQRHEGSTVAGAYKEYPPPPPPPKDEGYTPRSSIGPQSAHLPPSLFDSGLRISTAGQLDSGDIHPGAEVNLLQGNLETQGLQSPLPPPPVHAPPAPPTPVRMPHNIVEIPQLPVTMSERSSNDLSPVVRKNLWSPPTGSSRPSVDSQRPSQAPGSMSVVSLNEQQRSNSLDQESSNLSGTTKADSSNPESKRLHRRRHIVKELLDTENTYHQDLKIIEDIYKATAGDLVSTEDKKTLFGNCDEIEKFSLQFYDELRKSVTAVYVPPKQTRWTNRRGSFSTTQSDGTTQTTLSNDPVDDEKDRCTVVGHTFIRNLPRMEQVYGTYLKNHDAANQRLAAVQSTPSVKCWLDECHKNASDITSAWDLDSLLVKPTQRVAKYPMLLQQLLDCTPPDHPDLESLKTATANSISMLTRINEAKKRADLVDQIVNRKAKDSKSSGGFTFKLKGRTEKLKERVGVAEAFQDSDFDELAHRFGGHFIRLQICMRDVQDYMNRTERAINQINNNAQALEQLADATPSSLPEYEAKWRRYSQAVRELTAVALEDHKTAVSKRVIQPMVACIKLHEGPQNAINKRKKRIVDYARGRAMEKRGEKPDKRTQDAADVYVALNDQLKIDLPKLYGLTGSLVQGCLKCFLDIQLKWFKTWELKLTPILDNATTNIQQILPAFRADHDLVVPQLMELSICNGSLLADAANFLSPSTTLTAEDYQASSGTAKERRPSTLNSKRTMSSGSDVVSGAPNTLDPNKRHSGGYSLGIDPLVTSTTGRGRSNSSLSARQTSGGSMLSSTAVASTSTTSRPFPSQTAGVTPPSLSSSHSRPSTANQPPPSSSSGQFSAAVASYLQQQQQPARLSADASRSPRPSSSTTRFPSSSRLPPPSGGAPESSSAVSSATNTPNANSHRFSGIFSSAMPPSDSSSPAIHPFSSPNPSQGQSQKTQVTSPQAKPSDVPAQFVCASLFEFNIDGTRREAGYPYLTYTQGEVFDVIAQKGELWLARNQDDPVATLGWIWEQHFVVLSAD